MSVLDRIQNYLEVGGLFNPEMMEHEKVRELIMDCRTEIERLEQQLKARNSSLPWEALDANLISLNAAQEALAKEWASDDRLWTTQETVEFNLSVFARCILKEEQAPKPP